MRQNLQNNTLYFEEPFHTTNYGNPDVQNARK